MQSPNSQEAAYAQRAWRVDFAACSVLDFTCPMFALSRSPLCSQVPQALRDGVIKACQSSETNDLMLIPSLVLDLDPIRRADRKWSVYALIAYWFSDAFNAATWEFASSVIAIGLSYKDAVGIVATAFIIVSVVISLNGATGVLYHAPFPVLARAGWGFWGSYGMPILPSLGLQAKGYEETD